MLYFYSHIIEIESVIAEMDSLDLTEEQKMHLAVMIDSTLHFTVLDVIVSKLPLEERSAFVVRFKENPKDSKLWEDLIKRNDNLEVEIKQVIDDLKKELLLDIKEAKLLSTKQREKKK